MARQPALGHTHSGAQDEAEATLRQTATSRIPIVHSLSDPTTAILLSSNVRTQEEESTGESQDTNVESGSPVLAHDDDIHNSPSAGHRLSSSSYQTSPTNSRPHSPFTIPSRPSLYSTATSASFGSVDSPKPTSAESPRRPSILSRLKSSISTCPSVPSIPRRPSCQPSDFSRPTEFPERHFIDSAGMVIPGVCDRNPCSHPLIHFVVKWRLCEPIEYTTALADHGITYTDYCRLLAALANFLDEVPGEQKPRTDCVGGWRNRISSGAVNATGKDTEPKRGQVTASQDVRRSSLDLLVHFKKTEEQAVSLNNLLAKITSNWRERGLPVMVCISSFALFGPNRISEAHIQILHVSLQWRAPPIETCDAQPGHHVSFVDPLSGLVETHQLELLDQGNHSVAVPRRRGSDLSESPPSPGSQAAGEVLHHHQLHLRDRSRPWPLWPNAIPTAKRGLVEDHADRYGVDPYFRAWMRANIDSRTRCASYAKYMIEKEDNPFVNSRLEYVSSPSNMALLWNLVTKGYKEWKTQNPSTANRERYEHNRRLECRKTVENGSRLRIVQFGFRHPIHPPYTPEMSELGLSEWMYNHIIKTIEGIRQSDKPRDCAPRLISKMTQRRSIEDSLTKASAFIREVNNRQYSRLVWTIEKLPGVYDSFLSSGSKEWEISAWNSEAPLELLLQLEKWGVIEKKLDIEDGE